MRDHAPMGKSAPGTGYCNAPRHAARRDGGPLLQDATGAPDDQIVIGVQEVLASQAMEMGKIIPNVAGQ